MLSKAVKLKNTINYTISRWTEIGYRVIKYQKLLKDNSDTYLQKQPGKSIEQLYAKLTDGQYMYREVLLLKTHTDSHTHIHTYTHTHTHTHIHTHTHSFLTRTHT